MNIPFIDEFIDTQISYISVTKKIFADLELDPNNLVSAFTVFVNALQIVITVIIVDRKCYVLDL